MHGMNDEVNMRRYGGLRKVMPVTYVTFVLGYLAIIGIPPFSGFFTKDGIIESCFDKGGTSGAILGTAAVIGAGITAFYMTRMMFMTFFGKPRWEDEVPPERRETPEAGTAGSAPHPHESPAGHDLAADPARHRLGRGRRLPVSTTGSRTSSPRWSGRTPPFTRLFNVDVRGHAGGRAAGRRWPRGPSTGASGARVRSARHALTRGRAPGPVRRRVQRVAFMRPGQWLTRLSVYFDSRGVDGIVNASAAAFGGTSGRLRRMQTGFVRSYALSMFFGAALLVGALLPVRL